MVVKVKFTDVKDKYLVNVKDNTQMYMRVEADESNIEDAIELVKNNKYGVGIDYVGSIEALNNIDTNGVKVITHLNMVDGIDVQRVRDVCKNTNMGVTVAVKLAPSFSDMKTVYDLSREFENISFCGGHLLRLKGVNIGCIQPKDTNNKFEFKRYTTEGECACVCKAVKFNAENMEFRDRPLFNTSSSTKTKVVKAKKSSTPKTEKPKTSKGVIKSVFSMGDAFEGF